MRALLAVALGMGTLLPTAAYAESVWLIAMMGGQGGGMTSIEMRDMAQCREQQEEWRRVMPSSDSACIKGK